MAFSIAPQQGHCNTKTKNGIAIFSFGIIEFSF
jgi:hypothetical protein